MASYNLLDQTDEDALHAARLLNFEEKLFKRVTKRLLTPGSLVFTPQDTLPTPPPDDSTAEEDVAAATKEAELQRQAHERRKWQEDVYLDFEAFDSNIIRAQLLLNSNERERARYAEEKVRIQETAQAVRDRNAALHEQLKAAQRTLEVRKGYDALAAKITSNRALKPREEQHAQLEKLNAEIADLERESQEYAATWSERREQFGRIVEEGMQMLRLIRDEKEEAERKEGMEDIETEDVSRGGTSQAATPGGGATPAHVPEVGDKLSSPHGSKLKDELGVDAENLAESRAVSPMPAESQQGNAPVLDSQMTTGEEAGAESGIPPENVPQDEAAELAPDASSHQTTTAEPSSTTTPRLDTETEHMDTT